MRNLWFITNPNSGTATPEKCEAIEAVFGERGLTLAGRTRFPDEALPDGAALDAAAVDTVVLFAGDGTINAALCSLSDWRGAFLILPGGTMNLLAKDLHDTLDPHEIIQAAHQGAEKVALPYVEAGPHRAFVGLILGPAAHWFRAREEVRKRDIGRMVRAARHAWGRTFGRGVRVVGVSRLRRGYQAVFVGPCRAGVEVAAIDARDWRTILELGWGWVSGEWLEARAVTHVVVPQLGVGGSKPVLGLFDGEPVSLDPGTRIAGGISNEQFLRTKATA